MSGVTYFESIVVGLLQGVSELFPVSSLGHSVLLPALVGGRWAQDLSMANKHTPYLSILVAMHVATALALVLFFWRDWARLLRGLVNSIRNRRIETPEERLIWLLIAGTIPVALAGLALQTLLEKYLGKPVPAAIFLTLNGVVLYAAERLRRGNGTEQASGEPRSLEQTIDFSAEQTMLLPTVTVEMASDRRLSRLSFREAVALGAAQILGLLPGFSRSGSTMGAGLLRGLRHEDAARFAFLLATPAILGAGVLKLPALFTPENHAVLGPALVGSLIAGVASYISVRFLTSYFETRTLTPFALYCVIAGIGSLLYLIA